MDSLKDRVLDTYERYDTESLRSILASTDLNILQASGLSIVEILNAAIRCEDERLAESCLAAGTALLKQMDSDGRIPGDLIATVAMAAAKWDKIGLLEYCLDQGAEPSTYLGNAVACHGHERIFQLLMSRGLDVNACYGWQGDALCKAAWGKNLNMVKFLIDKGARLNSEFKVDRLYGPLAIAAMYNSTDMLGLLISRGVAIDGSLALHQAASFGRTDIMEYLITAGADVNEMPQEEGTETGEDFWPGRPIHFAADSRHFEAIKVLLKHGADPTQLGRRHQTVLELSIYDGELWKELEDLLRERDRSPI